MLGTLTPESIIQVSADQTRALDSAAEGVDLSDAALHDPAYQADIVAQLSEGAGSAFDDLVATVKHRVVEASPGFLVLRGLPVRPASTLLVAFSANLGVLVEPYQQAWSKMVRHIMPRTDHAVDGRVLNEFLHTDGTDWPQPNDYTCLFCVRPDGRGQGRSRLLTLESLMNSGSRAMEQVLAELVGLELPWHISDVLGGGVHWAPAITHDGAELRWLQHTVVSSVDSEIASLEPAVIALLSRFAEELERCPGVVDTILQPGDLLIIDNKRCLHARTPIADPSASDREIRRTKVMSRK